MSRTRLKVCCIGSVEEARLAVAAGADALGLVSAMPSGPGVIEEARIAEVVAAAPPPVATFLLTALTDPEEIAAQQRRCGASVLQLVTPLSPGAVMQLRALVPGIKLVPVVHVEDERSVAEAVALAPHADALLLDSGRPSLPVPELGGTGRTHDWTHSRAIVDAVPVPVFLAGGLHPDNVGEAIRTVRPFGLDLCSGVRTDGRLDAAKLRAFVAAVAAADAALLL
jgi:phosphoribosylanthranilate isomerase